MSQILLGQSYFLRFDTKLWKAMQPYPPLGTLYAASMLRERGCDVALFDAMLAQSVDEWVAELARKKPDFAVIFEDNFNYLSKMCLLNMRQAAFSMLAAAKSAGSTAITAGSDASDHPEDYLRAGADFVLIGEGELTLVELIDSLSGRSQKPIDDIAGLAYLDDDGIRLTASRPPIVDVDSLPFPARDLVDIDCYRQIWIEKHGYFSMNVVTTRGCPYHCNWCAKPIWGQRYNARSPENVVEELKLLKNTYHPDHIWFADDIAGLKPGWWQRYAELIEREDAGIRFKCLSRADLIVRSEETVNSLARAGCEIVWLGAESGSQKVLDAMEKGITVSQIYEATKRLHDAGIKVGFFLQFGYPGETQVEIDMTMRMVKECQPDDIGMSVSYPLPGTRFYENVRMQLGKKRNWTDSADLAMMYQGPYSTTFYRQLHVVLHKQFRWQRALRQMKTMGVIPWRWDWKNARNLIASALRIATLPLDKMRLNAMAKVSNEDIRPVSHMSHKEAALPTPQDTLG